MERMGLGNDAYLKLCGQRLPRRVERCRTEWNMADAVVVNSQVTYDSFASAGYEMDKVHIIPLGAPPPDPVHLKAWNPDHGKIRLLWVGPFMPRKGARILREALASPEWPENTHIDVLGSIPMSGLQSGLPPDRVRWHGPVTQAQVRSAMVQADALLLPTLADGFGMAITEAWSCGLPVLTTPQAGASEWMTDGIHGLKFPSGSTQAMISTLRNFGQRAGEWPKWRAACQTLAGTLSWKKYHKSLVAGVLDLSQLTARTSPPS